ncbi:MAG: glycosyltransferase family 9 protein [Bryobacteraceae bacterium]
MRRLLIRPGAIGDCILSLPALQHLGADFTEIWIPSAVVPLIRFADAVRPLASTGIDLVGVGDLTMSPRLKSRLQSFDSINSWYGTNRPEFRNVLESLGVECHFYPALPAKNTSEHVTDFFTQQVGAPEGLVPHIAVERSAPRDAIVIHPFSGSSLKNWPLNSYRELAAQLRLPIEWTAGPEQELSEAIRFTSLAELGSWIRGATLYIGNDSGITHLAAAVGVPTLALFGSSSPPNWAPRGDNVTVLHSTSLETLDVQTVLRAINRLLDSL